MVSHMEKIQTHAAEQRAKVVAVCRDQGWDDSMIGKMDEIISDAMEDGEEGARGDVTAQVATNRIIMEFYGLSEDTLDRGY